MRDILLFFSFKYNGNWNRIYSALENKEKVDIEEVIKCKNENDSKFITIIDENYPLSFKKISKPPFVIFYKGNISLIDERPIYIEGKPKEQDFDECRPRVIFTKNTEMGFYLNNLHKIYGVVSIFENLIDMTKSGLDFKFSEKILIVSEKPNKDKIQDKSRVWDLCAIACQKLILLNKSIKSYEFEMIDRWSEYDIPIFFNKTNTNENITDLLRCGAIEFSELKDII